MFQSVQAKALDDYSQVDAIYADFQKAFDTVDHNILFGKFKAFIFYSLLLLLV